MVNGRWLRAGLVGASIALAAVLYFLPKGSGVGNNAKPKQEPVQTAGAFSEEGFKKKSKSLLPFNLIAKADSLEGLLKAAPKDTSVIQSLVSFWDEAKSPAIAAGFSKLKATQTGLEKDWIGAAYRYFDATKAATDSLESVWFVSQAMEAYNKVLEINPKNLNAKTDLGILYAEASPEPMKGITLLREVVAEDPLHENAQMNLGFLSMKSGQYDKAIERFNQVLKINSSRIHARLHWRGLFAERR